MRVSGTDSVKKFSIQTYDVVAHNIFYGEIMNIVHLLSPCRRCAVHFAKARICYTINQRCQALEQVEPS